MAIESYGALVKMNSIKWTPFILCIVTIIINIDAFSLAPFIASYARELNAAPLMVGLIVASYAIVNDIFQLPLGYFMDKLGRGKLLLMIGLVADAVAMLAYSLSRIPKHLLLTRIFHG